MIDALRERLDAAERGRAAYIARADEDSQHYDGKGECDTTVVKDKCWGCVARESEAEAETLRGKLERAREAWATRKVAAAKGDDLSLDIAEAEIDRALAELGGTEP